MRHLMIAGLLAAAASPLIAQAVAPPVPPAPVARTMTMGMAKTMTRAEVQAQVQTQFAKRDTNRDGVLTREELAVRGGMGMRQREQRGATAPGQANEQGRAAMRDPAAAFDRLDADRNGLLSRDEFARGREIRVERRIIKMGPVDTALGDNVNQRRKQNGGMRRGNGGMMGAAMLRMADANRDGRVTLAEATTGALQQFDRLDTNRDGQLTGEERAAGRMQVRQMRRAG